MLPGALPLIPLARVDKCACTALEAERHANHSEARCTNKVSIYEPRRPQFAERERRFARRRADESLYRKEKRAAVPRGGVHWHADCTAIRRSSIRHPEVLRPTDHIDYKPQLRRRD